MEKIEVVEDASVEIQNDGGFRVGDVVLCNGGNLKVV